MALIVQQTALELITKKKQKYFHQLLPWDIRAGGGQKQRKMSESRIKVVDSLTERSSDAATAGQRVTRTCAVRGVGGMPTTSTHSSAEWKGEMSKV